MALIKPPRRLAFAATGVVVVVRCAGAGRVQFSNRRTKENGGPCAQQQPEVEAIGPRGLEPPCHLAAHKLPAPALIDFCAAPRRSGKRRVLQRVATLAAATQLRVHAETMGLFYIWSLSCAHTFRCALWSACVRGKRTVCRFWEVVCAGCIADGGLEGLVSFSRIMILMTLLSRYWTW